MEEYKGKTDVKNSSNTVDFGYYEVVIRTQEGGRIDTGKEYIAVVERIGMDLLRIVLRERKCTCLKEKAN
jgi:hypothetical protein